MPIRWRVLGTWMHSKCQPEMVQWQQLMFWRCSGREHAEIISEGWDLEN